MQDKRGLKLENKFRKIPLLGDVLLDQVSWCNIKQFLSYLTFICRHESVASVEIWRKISRKKNAV